MAANVALIHPGEILLTEFMEPLGLTAQNAFFSSPATTASVAATAAPAARITAGSVAAHITVSASSET